MVTRFEQCELLQAMLGRLPSLHAGDGDGVPDALGSGFSVQVGGIHGSKCSAGERRIFLEAAGDDLERSVQKRTLQLQGFIR
jgi:hypothetical protein